VIYLENDSTQELCKVYKYIENIESVLRSYGLYVQFIILHPLCVQRTEVSDASYRNKAYVKVHTYHSSANTHLSLPDWALSSLLTDFVSSFFKGRPRFLVQVVLQPTINLRRMPFWIL
jgi:hypothetical protein